MPDSNTTTDNGRPNEKIAYPDFIARFQHKFDTDDEDAQDNSICRYYDAVRIKSRQPNQNKR